MILTVLGFLTSPIGRIVGYGIAALFASGMLWTMIRIHDQNVTDRALAKFNQMQLEQVIENQDKLIKNLDVLQKKQSEIGTNLENKEVVTEQKIEDIKKKIEVEKDNASSPVLKTVLEELLKDINKEKKQ